MKYKDKKRKNKQFKETVSREIPLSDEDRILYIYKSDTKRNISEVTNVSYEILLQDQWVTIVRYDSSHGYLHRHLVISYQNPGDTPSTIGVKRLGSHDKWLTWAVEDVKKRYFEYKRGFLKRSKMK